jgi:penicillin-binding protein 1A
MLNPFTHSRRLLAWLLVALTVGVLGLGLFLKLFLADLPTVQSLDNYTPSLVTKLYDVRGELITELFVEKRSLLPLTQIPLAMQQAVLATEDNNFYNHMGIDLLGILRAMGPTFARAGWFRGPPRSRNNWPRTSF